MTGALDGKIVYLGANLWNEKVAAAISRDGHGNEIKSAADVFFVEILPELQNFMEQKISVQAEKPNLNIEQLTEMWESERQSVKNITAMYGDAVEALNKIHDLVGQIRGDLAEHPHLGAIQAWCHKVTGDCAENPEAK